MLLWQRGYEQYRKVQFAYWRSGKADKLAGFSEEHLLPVGWLLSSWSGSWRTRIVGLMGLQWKQQQTESANDRCVQRNLNPSLELKFRYSAYAFLELLKLKYKMSWSVKGFLELVRFTISKLNHCYNLSVSKRSSSSFPQSNAHTLFLNWISFNLANFAISLLSWMRFYTISGIYVFFVLLRVSI